MRTKILSINFSSLRYRIAIMLVMLSTILVSYILWETLSFNADQTRNQLNEIDKVTVDLLADLARISLFSRDYDSIQSHVMRVSNDLRVQKIYVARFNDIIIASTDLAMIGEPLPLLSNDGEEYWNHREFEDQGSVHVQFSSNKQQVITNETRALGLKLGGIGLLIIALVGTMLGHILTKRLSALTDAVKKYNIVTEEITIDKELLSSKDEVGELARTFNVMHLHIIEYIDKIKMETEERLNAQSANEIKSNFMANMSHELRTPLNAIIGYCELLMESKSGREKTEFDDLLKIHLSGKHLLRLIDDILDLSKIEAGKVALDYSVVNVGDLLSEVSKSVYPQLLENKNELILNIDAELSPGIFDETKLRQVLLNLLSNSCKFTKAGLIKLDLSPAKIKGINYYVISVSDTGIGMKSQQCENVFKPYTQADSSTTRKFGGTGLGLTISKTYCEMMGGNIEVSSEYGKGSTFTVFIP
ncbi:MAG: ATP-binding protein, partial [Thiohalomonadales bacterium]